MIRVQTTQTGGVFQLRSEGHADYRPGNDPVCAAVSALLYTLLGALENLTQGGKRDETIASGCFFLRYAPGSAEDASVAALLFDMTLIGLLQLEAAHPAHLTVQAEEYQTRNRKEACL